MGPIYHDWDAYQSALSSYVIALRSYQAKLAEWNAQVRKLELPSRQFGLVLKASAIGILASTVLALARQAYDEVLWVVAYVGVLAFYGFLDIRCQRWVKRTFVLRHPAPQFLLEEPVYIPPGRADTPPKAAPPPCGLSLDGALAVLGLSRKSTDADLRRAFRELMQQYHPDKVRHLGPELRELAEEKAKQINAAYEYLRKAFRARTTTA